MPSRERSGLSAPHRPPCSKMRRRHRCSWSMRQRARVFLLAQGALLISVSSSTLHAAQPLVGTVRDGGTLLPVPYAIVELAETGSVTQADGDGRFIFAPVPNGEYHLCAWRIGYRRLCDVIVRVGAEEQIPCVLPLHAEPLPSVGLEIKAARSRRPPGLAGPH